MPAAVEPLPPVAPGRLPRVGSGLALLRNATRYLTRMRARPGDTFVVDAFGCPIGAVARAARPCPAAYRTRR